ncbi:MAG: hypothetical protein OXU19_06160 [bacterium]|nr:hypothetical protein [bacterium]MDE0415444.1 hypothetical protein [bacterium]
MAHAKIDVLSLSSPAAACDIGGCGLTWCQAETDRSWRGVAIRGDHEDFTLFEAELHALPVPRQTITNDVQLNARSPKDVGKAFVVGLAYGDGREWRRPSVGPGVLAFNLGAPAERTSALRAVVADRSR